ncbi:unnamed protein product [Calypogeia fissa]
MVIFLPRPHLPLSPRTLHDSVSWSISRKAHYRKPEEDAFGTQDGSIGEDLESVSGISRESTGVRLSYRQQSCLEQPFHIGKSWESIGVRTTFQC